MLPTKFQVSWPFCSEEEVINKFPRWPPWRPYWISDRNDFNYFDQQITPVLPSKFPVNWPLGSGEVEKIDVQDDRHCGYIGCPIGMILAMIDL